MILTEKQYDAVTCRGGNVLVSAAAGAGKTRVLVERVISYVKNSEVNIDQFLLITYTRAAAGEMRERITGRLRELIAEDPRNAHLQRQLYRVYSAHIGTLHSFCRNILREFSHFSEWPPDAIIAEENQLSICRDRILAQTLEDAYENLSDNDGFKALVSYCMDMRGDLQLRNMLMQCWEATRGFDEPEKKRVEFLYKFSSGIESAMNDLLEDIRAQAELVTFRLYGVWKDLDGLDLKYEATAREDFERLQKLTECFRANWTEAQQAVSSFSFGRAKPLKEEDKSIAQVQEAIAVRKEAKSFVERIQNLLTITPQEHMEDIQALTPLLECLLHLTDVFDRAYRAERIRRKWLDFMDLEHEAYRLLSIKEVNETVSSRFCEIMVDEYQDINRLQDGIINRLSRPGGNVFYVGDVRQSIYSFQRAEPGIFLKKLVDENTYKIFLSLNFRSHPSILTSINNIFSRLMRKGAAGMDYGEPIEYGGLPEVSGLANVEMLVVPCPEDDEVTHIEEEARFVARRLKQLIDNGEAVAGDCAILLRSFEGRAEIFQKVLIQAGIPCTADLGGDDFFLEVSVILAFLKLLDNPYQDIPLLTLLRSPLCAFTPDMLAELRMEIPTGSLYQCLRASKWNKSKDIIQTLDYYRELSLEMSVWQLVSKIYAGLSFFSWCENKESLHSFLEIAGHAPEGGLTMFLLWFERFKENKSVPPVNAERLEGAARIMTIHRSKGLEFPIVVVADLGKKFNRRETVGAMLFHQEAGFGLKRRTELYEYPTLSHYAVKRHIIAENMAEELRVLYVALTRAKKRLIMACSVKNQESFERHCRMAAGELLPQAFLEAGSMAHWLWMCSEYFSFATEEDYSTVFIEESLPESIDAAGERCLEEAYHYPYVEATSIPSKVTASGLKGRFVDTEVNEEAASLYSEYIPKGIKLPGKDEVLSSAERGAAIHLAMQLLDYSKCTQTVDIQKQIHELLEKNNLTPKQAAVINPHKIYILFQSPLGKRMLASKKLRKEVKFSFTNPAERFFGVSAAGEEILVQGVIDCYFAEEDGIVIVDYKTDLISPGQEMEKAEKYANQLEVYAIAAAGMTGERVKECWLYFFKTDTPVRLPLMPLI